MESTKKKYHVLFGPFMSGSHTHKAGDIIELEPESAHTIESLEEGKIELHVSKKKSSKKSKTSSDSKDEDVADDKDEDTDEEEGDEDEE